MPDQIWLTLYHVQDATTQEEGTNLMKDDDQYYCEHCGVSPCANLTDDCVG